MNVKYGGSRYKTFDGNEHGGIHQLKQNITLKLSENRTHNKRKNIRGFLICILMIIFQYI